MLTQYALIDLRYSCNCATTLTGRKPFYLVGTMNNNGYFQLSVTTTNNIKYWYTQDLPTTDDGKVYIYLGMVYTDTNGYRLQFEQYNPIYYYKDGAIRIYDLTGRGIASVTKNTSNYTVTRDNGSTFNVDFPTAAQVGAATSGHNHDSTYLKLSGGTLTGFLTLSRETTTAANTPAKLEFSVKDTDKNQTNSGYIAYYNDHTTTYNGAFVMSSCGNTFIGGGESAASLYAAKGASNTGENLFLTADSQVYVYAYGDTAANRIGFVVNTSGHILPQKAESANNNVQNLGASNNKWANVYATTFTGNLTGNVTGNVSGTAANVTGTVAVANGGTGVTSIANIQAGKDGDGNIISSTYLKLSGGKLSGNLELNAASGNSPALIFTRDGGLTDWRILVTSGKLSFCSATDASTWTERAYFADNSGNFITTGSMTATSFSGSGASLTSLNASNIASGTVPFANLPTGTGANQIAVGNHTHNYITKLSTSTDNAIVRFDGTSGQVQNSGVTIDDNHNIITDKSLQTGRYFYNVIDYYCTNTPKELLIKTKFPFTNGNEMPKIIFHINQYSKGVPAEITLVFYIYSGEFCNFGATSDSLFRPTITLSKYTENNTDYVAIGLGLIGTAALPDGYYIRFNIDVLDIWGTATRDYTKNWSIETNTTDTSIIPTEKRKIVDYKDASQAASLTTTTNAIAYYTNTAGTFGTKASANGALYATSANGTLQWGTLPVAQGGTGATTAAGARTNLGLGTMATETATNYLAKSGGTMTGTANITWADSGSWGASDATFPLKRGGLSWTGTSDSVKIYAEETSSDMLNLIIDFGDDTNPELRLRDRGSTDSIKMCAGSGTITATTFSGSGASLTSLNGSNISSGTVADARIASSIARLASPAFTGTPTAPTAANGTNTTQIATTAFVMNAFTANDAMIFKGVINANSSLPATHYQGWTYKVATAGTYADKVCEVGDMIICVTDGTSANNDHWAVI